jgi:complement component 1 Q subcomponent-binding protein
MLSLRAFTRAAPRISTRIATSSSLLRPSFQSAVRRNGVSVIGRAVAASFSTSGLRFVDQHSQQLALKLDAEIDLEHEDSKLGTGSDDGVKQFFAENPDWSVADAEGEQDVFLTRKHEDEDVTVHFSISDFNNPMQDDMAMEDDVLGDEEDLEGQSGGANSAGSRIQGRTSDGNFKVGTEDGNAPADHDEHLDEVCFA